jgi:Rrf2 family protein
MFTFTKKADYALLALSFLASEGVGRLVGPREIARRYEIPAELLAKVMQTLAKNHLVASVPGPTGGYRLEKAVHAISVGDVVEAVDGPLAIAQCWEVTGTAGCAQARHCTLRGPLARIQEEMARLLRAMTLEDVMTPDIVADLPIHRAAATGFPLTMASPPSAGAPTNR